MADDSLKFVWAYMLEQGRITDGNWNYYGSSFSTPPQMGWREIESAMIEVREKVKTIGIDWKMTVSPESGEESGFNDTYSPSSRVPTLLGVLYLKDGSGYTIGVADPEERFQNYVEALRNLMEDKQRVKDILGE